MINPKILRLYEYRVLCKIDPDNALLECSDYFKINFYDLSVWLRNIDAIGSHRLTTI